MKRRPTIIDLIIMYLLAGLLVSCSAAEQTGKGKKKTEETSDSAKLPGKDDDGASTSGTESDGEESGDDDPGTEEDPEAKLKALLADCGANDIDSSDPNKVIYEKTLNSFPVKKTVLVVNVTVASTLKVTVTGKETKQDSLVEVKEITGLGAELARGAAESQAKDSSGLATLTNVPFDEYSSLSDHDAWSGIVCTFVPITKIVNERGGKNTTVTFDPPLPSSLSPKAVASRFEAEIGKKKTFDDIKATISSSDHPALDGKKSVSGTVTVTKVEPEADVDDGAGGTYKIKADIAFKMNFDFDTPAITYALGLAPVVTYYISHEKKDMVANIVDTSEASGAVATFIHDK